MRVFRHNRRVIGLAAALAVIVAAVGVIAIQPQYTQAQETYPINASIGKPTNLTASSAQGQVSISWDAPENQDVDGYQVQRRFVKKGEIAETIEGNTGNNLTHYLDAHLTTGGNYSYRVRTIQDGEVSKPSKPVEVWVTFPAGPTNQDQLTEAEQEVVRLNRIIQENVHGCILFDTDEGGSGKDYDTSFDDTKCLTLSQLVVDACIPHTHLHRYETRRITMITDAGTLR